MSRVLLLIVALLLALPAGCGGGAEPPAAPRGAPSEPERPPLRLGTKNFTEQFILGELYRQALESRGFEVELKRDIGSSEIIDAALEIGSLDMYPEYTGVMLSELAGVRDVPASADATYRAAKAFQEERGFTLLAMTPFSDSNALAVKPAFARRHGLRTIADLAKVPGGVTIGAPPEFRTRHEGLLGLREVYGLKRVRMSAQAIGRQYGALDRGRVDVATVFTTDGQLSQRRYVLLRDTEGLFGFQNVAPVVSRRLRRDRPDLVRVIDAVSARLGTEAMREMNAAVDARGQKPADVARRFLESHGLV